MLRLGLGSQHGGIDRGLQAVNENGNHLLRFVLAGTVLLVHW